MPTIACQSPLEIQYLVYYLNFKFFQFHQKESSYVEMDFILPRGSSVGLYARKNAIPTLTLNDIRDVLSGYRSMSTLVQQNSAQSTRHSRSIVSFQKSWLTIVNADVTNFAPILHFTNLPKYWQTILDKQRTSNLIFLTTILVPLCIRQTFFVSRPFFIADSTSVSIF